MSSRVYGHTASTCTQRVLLLLEELGQPYELLPIDMMKGEHHQPAYMEERQPFGRIPAFEDSELKLYESRAICRYLVARYAGPLSLPTNTSDLALFEQAASIEYSYFDPAVSNLAYEKLFKAFMGRGQPDMSLVEKYEATMRQCLDVYDQVLSKKSYLAGEDFSLVDLFHAPWINFLPRLGYGVEIESRPNVSRWWASVSSRPSWGSLLGKIGH